MALAVPSIPWAAAYIPTKQHVPQSSDTLTGAVLLYVPAALKRELSNRGPKPLPHPSLQHIYMDIAFNCGIGREAINKRCAFMNPLAQFRRPTAS